MREGRESVVGEGREGERGEKETERRRAKETERKGEEGKAWEEREMRERERE